MSHNSIFHRRELLRAGLLAPAGYLVARSFPSSVSAGGLAAVSSEERPSGTARAEGPLSVEDSLRLAGKHLIGVLNPEDNYLPYWQLTVTPEYEAALARWWPAHNIGRWLDAMYRLEAELDFSIPEEIDKAMLKNAQAFFDNPDVIPVNPTPWPHNTSTTELSDQWDLHSIREGLLALNALARYRNSDWAAETGRKMIQSLDDKLRDDGTWDLEKFDTFDKRGRNIIHAIDPSDTHGRYIEALIWFYETTRAPEAIAFAKRLAEWHFENTLTDNGEVNPRGRVDHTHSYLGTLRGLLLYGRLTHQGQYIRRVAKAYDVTVRPFIHESGYTSHNMVKESFGETTSPGDAAQLALWLTQEGYSEYLDDADRLVRSRILPSQILETPDLKPLEEFGEDATTNLEQRIIGAYGGCHSHPHAGKLAVTDVTAADVHTLVDVHQHITVPDAAGLQVFLHLDVDNEHATVKCEREQRGTLEVVPKRDVALALRIPQWTPRNTLSFTVDGEKLDPTIAGHFARTGKIPAGSVVTMQYDLPEKQITETALGYTCQVHFKGDDVVGVTPNPTFYPFYPDAAKDGS